MGEYVEMLSMQFDRAQSAFKLNLNNGHAFYVYHVEASEAGAYHLYVDRCQGCTELLRMRHHLFLGEAMQALGINHIHSITLKRVVDDRTEFEGVIAIVSTDDGEIPMIVTQAFAVAMAQNPPPAIYVEKILYEEQEFDIAKTEAAMMKHLDTMPEALKEVILKAYKQKQIESLAPITHTLEEVIKQLEDEHKEHECAECGDMDCDDHPAHQTAKPKRGRRGEDNPVG